MKNAASKFQCATRTSFKYGRRIGKVIGKVLKCFAIFMVALLVLYFLGCMAPELKELMPALFKLAEVFLSAFDHWLMNTHFMAHWF